MQDLTMREIVRWFSEIHPGEYIKEEMEYMGLKLKQFAELLEITQVELYKLIRHEIPITEHYARKLSERVSYQPALWLNLEKGWKERQEYKAASQERRKALAESKRIESHTDKL